MKDSLRKKHDNIKAWPDMYGGCDIESKKMILLRLIQSVKVKRDYEIKIEFAIDFHHLGAVFDSPEWGSSTFDERAKNQVCGTSRVSAEETIKADKSKDLSAFMVGMGEAEARTS